MLKIQKKRLKFWKKSKKKFKIRKKSFKNFWKKIFWKPGYACVSVSRVSVFFATLPLRSRRSTILRRRANGEETAEISGVSPLIGLVKFILSEVTNFRTFDTSAWRHASSNCAPRNSRKSRSDNSLLAADSSALFPWQLLSVGSAPWPIKREHTSTRPFAAASWSGVNCQRSKVFGFAPQRSKISTTSMWP